MEELQKEYNRVGLSGHCEDLETILDYFDDETADKIVEYLKAGGKLVATLPATETACHGFLPCGRWLEVPSGASKNSSTNITTTRSK